MKCRLEWHRRDMSLDCFTSTLLDKILAMASLRTSTIMLTFELVVTTTSFPLGVQTAYRSFLATGRLVVILALLVSQNLAETQFTAYSSADATCIWLTKWNSELDVASEDCVCSQAKHDAVLPFATQKWNADHWHSNSCAALSDTTAAFSPDAFFIKADKPVRI